MSISVFPSAICAAAFRTFRHFAQSDTKAVITAKLSITRKIAPVSRFCGKREIRNAFAAVHKMLRMIAETVSDSFDFGFLRRGMRRYAVSTTAIPDIAAAYRRSVLFSKARQIRYLTKRYGLKAEAFL